jgi:hypothetical protein
LPALALEERYVLLRDEEPVFSVLNRVVELRRE